MKLRLAILTSIARGTASRVLPALLQSDKLSVAGAILIQTPPRQRFRIKPKKIRQIGLLGALNGLRMRSWYADNEAPDLQVLCAEMGVPCIKTDSTNGQQTCDALATLNADLGLSLGNDYIHPRVFEIPRFGMINVHGEILPEFKGAQSVIWPIYAGRTMSGLTVHQVAKSIDGGDILYQREIPIIFRNTLRATVERTTQMTRSAVPDAVRLVCENYHDFQTHSVKQVGGDRYTTPSLLQFARMLANHQRLYRSAPSTKPHA